MLSSLRVYV
uniref:Uncharacterized protein n=1 Tax=Anguilla anguilla TaxID=7936 RepID=A0A0E9S8E9_ANGAN